MTSAAKDGAWTSGSFVASGEFDQSINCYSNKGGKSCAKASGKA